MAFKFLINDRSQKLLLSKIKLPVAVDKINSYLKSTYFVLFRPSRAVFGPATNFFCLLRDILSEFSDGKGSTPKVFLLKICT